MGLYDAYLEANKFHQIDTEEMKVPNHVQSIRFKKNPVMSIGCCCIFLFNQHSKTKSAKNIETSLLCKSCFPE